MGSCSGNFYAFQAADGEVLWTYDTSRDGNPANFHGDVLVADSVLVFGSDATESTGYVYALEQKTGNVRWKHREPGGVVSEIVRDGERVYGVSSRGALVCLSLQDGRLLWRADADSAGENASLRYSAIFHAGAIVYSSRDGWLFAVDAETGEHRWATRLESTVNTELRRIDDVVYVGTHGGSLFGVHVETGEPRFALDLVGMLYGISPPNGQRIYVLAEDVGLVCVDPQASRVCWTQDLQSMWSSFRPLIYDGLIWAGNEAGVLYGFDLDTGEPRRDHAIDGVVRGFAFLDGRLWIGTLDGTLYACKP